MKTTYVSFWLVPQTPYPFQLLIDQLATQFDTVAFPAHLTLCSQEVPLSFNLEQLLMDLTASAPIVTLTVRELASESNFSKTLFVRFEAQVQVQRLVDRIVANIPNAIAPPFDPHLSLLYHSLTSGQKADLLKEITISQSSVIFDKVQIIAAPRVFETQDHVAQLHCLYQRPL